MTHRHHLLLSLVLLAACGDDDAPVDAGSDAASSPDAGEPDAATDLGRDAGRADGCLDVDVGAFALDVREDTGFRIRAPLTPDIDDERWGLHVWFQRFGDSATEGTVQLGEAPNEDFPDCPHCVIALEGVDLSRGYFATEGTMELRRDPYGARVSFELRDVILREVTIGPGEFPGTITATLVPDGGCLALPTVDVDDVFPPEEWRCGNERYADGASCDCACGAWDPDCFPCDEFPPDPECDPTPLPLVGCADGQVCSGVDAECVGDCSETGTCSFGTCVWWIDGQRICETDTDRFDPAALGEDCGETFGLTYCAEDVGVAHGVCAQWVDADTEDAAWECRAFCESDADCDADAHERCEMIFGGVAGHCMPAYPPSWTCHPAVYRDGATCHCGCGAWDPDCGETYQEPVAGAAGCATGDVCVPVDELSPWSQSECVTAPVHDTCATAELLALPFEGMVTTRGSRNDYEAASCFPNTKGGHDIVYAVTLAVGQTLTVTAMPVGTRFDPGLYLVGPGEPSVCSGAFSCAATADEGFYDEPEELTFTAVEAGTHYLVLDSWAPWTGTVQLIARVE